MLEDMTKAQTLEAMLAALTVGGRMNPEKSRAQPRRYYGDPANHIKFESEKGGLMQEALGTKEIESILKHEIDNWVRWGKKRDWMPVGFRCPLGFMYKSTDVHEASYKPLPCDEGNAARFERIVISLPERHRSAFVMHQLDKAHVQGWIVILRGRDDKARILGVQKSRYHELVSQAYNIVLREWKKFVDNRTF
ncbi:MAG TPA: hypothetical protein VJ654_14120 [Noviherbaspirillum sp.]|nr:hypothetical protein [Noviherbaspirillum sp.]